MDRFLRHKAMPNAGRISPSKRKKPGRICKRLQMARLSYSAFTITDAKIGKVFRSNSAPIGTISALWILVNLLSVLLAIAILAKLHIHRLSISDNLYLPGAAPPKRFEPIGYLIRLEFG